MRTKPGQRVRDVTQTNTTDEAYGAGGELLWRFTGNSSDPNQRAFVSFSGGILAEYYSGGTIFDHPDQIGSMSTSSDYTGNSFNEKLFYPFGELWTGAAIPNFNTHQTFAHLPDYDPETDQYNTLNRHSSPSGRWLSPDPFTLSPLHIINPQRWNIYAYALNNPTTFVDPTGLDAIAVDFSTKAVGMGHWGIISVNRNGSATYADFGPRGGGKPTGPGEYKVIPLTTKLAVAPSGIPQPSTFAELQKELAGIEGVSADSISFAYFRTSDADTASLNTLLKGTDVSGKSGNAPYYCVGSTDCRGYTLSGLSAAGIHPSFPANTLIGSPNTLFEFLQEQADAYYSSSQGRQLNSVVTSQICYGDGRGNRVCY